MVLSSRVSDAVTFEADSRIGKKVSIEAGSALIQGKLAALESMSYLLTGRKHVKRLA